MSGSGSEIVLNVHVHASQSIAQKEVVVKHSHTHVIVTKRQNGWSMVVNSEFPIASDPERYSM